MQPLADWFLANATKLTEVFVALAAVAVAVVALTPTKRDDDALKGLLASLSNTRKAIGGTAVGAALAAIAALLLGGCAHALSAAEGARAQACIEVESACIDRAEAGEITVTQAEACVSCARSTCDVIRERMVSR